MKVCTKCLYDSNMPEITFDENGVCSYCEEHEQMNMVYPTGEEGEKRLQKIVDIIKKDGKGKEYDVVIGASGGCDSSFLIHKSVELGLRPLVSHFDNNWNAPIGVENLTKIVNKLDLDLEIINVDQTEYDNIITSFLIAGVPEIECAADIGLAVANYLNAEKYGIKYIFNGHSFRTEGITPVGWFYMDGKYIESVHKQYGTIPIKSFQNLNLERFIKWTGIDKVKRLRPIYYIDYDKEATKKMLNKEYGWQWYGGHHHENIFTIFSNRYWLPAFGVDLRKVEYSAHVRTGTMTREKAIEKMAEPIPFDPEILDTVANRLGITKEYIENKIAFIKKNKNNANHRNFETYQPYFKAMEPFFRSMCEKNLIPRTFYMKYCR